LGWGNDRHIPVSVIFRSDPVGPDGGRAIWSDLIGPCSPRALLVKRLAGITLIILREVLPVAVGVELPALLQAWGW